MPGAGTGVEHSPGTIRSYSTPLHPYSSLKRCDIVSRRRLSMAALRGVSGWLGAGQRDAGSTVSLNDLTAWAADGGGAWLACCGWGRGGCRRGAGCRYRSVAVAQSAPGRAVRGVGGGGCGLAVGGAGGEPRSGGLGGCLADPEPGRRGCWRTALCCGRMCFARRGISCGPRTSAGCWS